MTFCCDRQRWTEGEGQAAGLRGVDRTLLSAGLAELQEPHECPGDPVLPASAWPASPVQGCRHKVAELPCVSKSVALWLCLFGESAVLCECFSTRLKGNSLSTPTALLENQQFTHIMRLTMKSTFTLFFSFIFLPECLNL